MRRLEEFCTRHDLPWTAESAEQFAAFLKLLQQFNKAMNLIGPMSDDEVVETLFVDSIAPASLAPPNATVLDVGTGAGFPGIPLALLYPQVAFTLVEPRQKRTQFLEIAVNRLGLENVEVVRARIEDVEPARFDWVISKAFRNPDVWLEIATNWVSEEGVIVALYSADHRPAMLQKASELGLESVTECEDTTSLGVTSTAVVRGITVWG